MRRIAAASVPGPLEERAYALRIFGRSDPAGPLTLAFSGAPIAPPVGSVTLFANTNVAGKTQLNIRFPSGPVQVLATEA